MITITATVSAEDIIEGLSTQDEVFKLIKALEFNVADVDFTKKLARYFVAEYCKEYDEDETFNAQELLPVKHRKK